MKKRFSVYLVMFAAISLLLAACGGGGGGAGVDPNAAATVTVTADKRIALANGSEDITLTAQVTNYAGALLSGKAISFVITSGTGTLHSADLTTNASGTAGVKVNRGPITPLTKEDIIVKATADSASGTKTVRFINRPDTATVLVGFTKSISDLAWVTFDLVSTPTQTPLPQVEAIGAADTLPFIGHIAVGQNTFVSIASSPYTYTLLTDVSSGLAVAPNSPFMQFVYFIDPAITSLPTFSIGPNNVTAVHPLPGSQDFVPALVQADFYETTTFDTE